MTAKRPVIAFVPREVFSTTKKCLTRLVEVTDTPFDLVCIDGNSDCKTQSFLEEFAAEKGFELIRSESYLSPNRARNMAYTWAKNHTDADYIVFVDNDALVTEGWLQALVTCADETGAGLVGPAYYEYLPECTNLHMYGGECGLERDARNRLVYFERHDCQHMAADELDAPLTRKKTGLIEFHTVLVRMNLLTQIGGLDEGLLCMAEHGDLSMQAKEHGFEIWMEPGARVTYVPPKRLAREDRDFFFLRWSEDRMAANQKHMEIKWGLDHVSDKKNPSLEWLRMHRRYGFRSARRIRKIFGRKIGRFYEKKIFIPLEIKWNRFKYASEKWS